MKKILLISALFILNVRPPLFAAVSAHSAGMEEFDVLKSRAETLVREGKPDDSIGLVKKFIKNAEAMFGPENPNLIVPREYLARIYFKKGEYKKAEKIYNRNIKALRSVFGDNHPKIAAYMNNLAVYYFDSKEFLKSEILLKKALKIYVKVYGAEHEEVVTARSNLSELQKIMSGQMREKAGKEEISKSKSKPYHTGSFIAYPYRQNSEMLFFDEAGLLNKEEREKALNILRGIKKRGEAVCFVVILKSMASFGAVGWGADVYAGNLLRNWGGVGESENRALLFVSVADHVVSLTGKGELFIKAKSRLDQIKEDSILGNFRSGKFSEGLLTGLKELKELSESMLSGVSE